MANNYYDVNSNPDFTSTARKENRSLTREKVRSFQAKRRRIATATGGKPCAIRTDCKLPLEFCAGQTRLAFERPTGTGSPITAGVSRIGMESWEA